ncbi:hypothetical protein KFK09_028152 [Dendrobium nobile]|uniref:Uncharacterized protein n=1 Tax=Dendrobium nobile TaxID=94219 RepID=A0A8T3A192_DENNO|nr:hypothetical protein KFK09_028152 [Dendrobium nobile]
MPKRRSTNTTPTGVVNNGRTTRVGVDLLISKKTWWDKKVERDLTFACPVETVIFRYWLFSMDGIRQVPLSRLMHPFDRPRMTLFLLIIYISSEPYF